MTILKHFFRLKMESIKLNVIKNKLHILMVTISRNVTNLFEGQIVITDSLNINPIITHRLLKNCIWFESIS